MVNAWSLAASILDGTFDKDYPIMTDIKIDTGVGNTATYTVSEDIEHSEYWYDYTRNDPDRPNPFSTDPLADNDDQIAHHVGLNYDELNLNIPVSYTHLTLPTKA